jgi:hypothetical protein
MEVRRVKKWRAAVSLCKLAVAALLAVTLTVSIGAFLGIPQDVDRLEQKLRAFEEATYVNGRVVSEEERDKALTRAGHTFHLPPSTTASAPVVHYSTSGLLEGALRWYPSVFGVSLLAFLALLRPGIPAGLVVLLAMAPLSFFLSEAVAVAVAVAGLAYLAVEVILRRTSASRDR